jgi:hypothetical protein
MFASIVVALLVASATAFHMGPSSMRLSRSSLSMGVPGGKLTAPGKNMKPQFDGTFKEAGAHLETYVLEHENGSRALVDTKTATCISWKTADGVEHITSPASVHRFPTAADVLKGEFVPEERAKKVSFDRMIFKAIVEDSPAIEYRADVTLREASLEYDITIKNAAAETKKVNFGLSVNVSGVKVTKIKGFKSNTDTTVETGDWEIPVGKFKETEFYVEIK